MIKESEAELPVKLPKDVVSYDTDFGKVTTMESLLESLQLRGFQRPLRAYNPPENLEATFANICHEVLGLDMSSDLSKIPISGKAKADLLSKLADNFANHRVPNSMVHTMTTLDKVLMFYSTKVDMLSPYDRIAIGVERGDLPQNIHVQIDPIIFNPDTATTDLGRISAFPGKSKIFKTPEERKKWKSYVPAKSPWKNSRNDD